jgi:hypothetical protein|tara:strand:- start:291 stop:488 length:198 start_codon:yes stop_codon:yes gene_type:complete
MVNFKKLLQETLEDNRIEMLMESREYTEDERVYMRGYNDALNDMLEDFTAEYNEFMENVNKIHLN